MLNIFVIPAKAGTTDETTFLMRWTPAFAGVTAKGSQRLFE
jgi:hypothetical protein